MQCTTNIAENRVLRKQKRSHHRKFRLEQHQSDRHRTARAASYWRSKFSVLLLIECRPDWLAFKLCIPPEIDGLYIATYLSTPLKRRCRSHHSPLGTGREIMPARFLCLTSLLRPFWPAPRKVSVRFLSGGSRLDPNFCGNRTTAQGRPGPRRSAGSLTTQVLTPVSVGHPRNRGAESYHRLVHVLGRVAVRQLPTASLRSASSLT